MKKVTSVVLNNFKNDSRVLKENISLQNAGYDVIVVALHEEPFKEFDIVENIPVHRIKLRSRNWSKHKAIQLIKYFEFIYRVVRKYKLSDIFHCNDLNTLAIGVIVKKFFNKNVKIVYDAHEYETETNGLNGFYQTIVRKLERVLIKYVDKTITVSNTIAQEYVRLYGIEKPALVLNTPYYRDIESTNIFREKFKITQDKTIFLYQGALNEGRGIETVLNAFKVLDAEYVVIFMGYGLLEEMIKNDAKKYNNIYFHEAVPPEVVLDYTASADFGISTIEDSCLSYRYCLPNKMFEYLMTNLPVIVSNLLEMKKIVEKYNIGVVTKENTLDGLQEAIAKAVILNKKVLQVNIQKVKEIYKWEEQEKVLLKLYGELYDNQN